MSRRSVRSTRGNVTTNMLDVSSSLDNGPRLPDFATFPPAPYGSRWRHDSWRYVLRSATRNLSGCVGNTHSRTRCCLVTKVCAAAAVVAKAAWRPRIRFPAILAVVGGTSADTQATRMRPGQRPIRLTSPVAALRQDLPPWPAGTRTSRLAVAACLRSGQVWRPEGRAALHHPGNLRRTRRRWGPAPQG